ncbi:LOG family protein [Salsipaludibacter albus]|uniref:LOG family protein n=1 Tax=Salsipaludibacter albus TaxID=2849650 RepID=UPI001EE410CA|nr:LOG family protein [Salsipaludibacter albus]MBY5164007.1 LOG family protein [Salsipaludibacter albus]
MAYSLGNDDLDRRIAELVADAGGGDDADLVGELITTALKLHRDAPARGDLKLINTALKEMRYSDLVFSRSEEPKVTIFGSARLHEDDPNYRLAMEFAAKMAEQGWATLTGAGPGIMEAGNRGAGVEHGYGVAIRLPFESSSNDYLAPERTVNFKYFFTRKLAFVKESQAFAIFPGGFGTLDEFFELITLIQTGKSDMHPIVLVEAPGTDYWASVFDGVSAVLGGKGLIGPDDTNLVQLCTDADAAVHEIKRFYANYHSQRFVDGELVMRMRHAPDDDQLAAYNREFAGILASGEIRRVEATPAEVADDDCVDLERLRLHFDRRSFGQLRVLIDRLADLVDDDASQLPTGHLTEEQAERPW